MRRRGSSAARGTPVLALVLGAALVAGGCEYLYGYGAGNPDDFGIPAPLARYVEGTARVSVGEAAAMDLHELSHAALYDDLFGAEATFSNDDGWYVRVSGATTGGMFGSLAYVTLDRVTGGQHWTTSDPGRCIVTIDAADATSLRGSAICKGLRWADAMAGVGMSLEPTYISGQDPFDAEIRFEARPSTTAPA